MCSGVSGVAGPSVDRVRSEDAPLPYEGIPPVGHSSSVRATFVDAAIERYLPGVEQFVELGAGYDTRTAQLQHNGGFVVSRLTCRRPSK